MTPSPASALAPARRARLLRLGLGFVLLWSLALRIWFGSADPTSARYWDERYALENVGELLSSGRAKPANGFYPSLSYLPQAAVLGVSQTLHRLTGIEALKVIAWDRTSTRDSPPRRNAVLPRGFTPSAYLLSRFTQAIFGVASVYLLFLVGRRLLSAEAGLLSALLLSGVFWHIRQSAIFKPDILLLLACLLAFLLTLEAAERPSRRAYLMVGGAVGLALSSKFNAGPVAVPLILATVFNRGLGLRIWGWLVLAGAVSVAVFVALNPYTVLEPRLYIEDFSVTLRNYAGRGAQAQSSHSYVLWHGLVSLLSRALHGPIIGLIGLVGGLVVLLRNRGRQGNSQSIRIGCAMAYAYMLSYAVLYALGTTNPSPHNWLPLAPYVALLAALSLSTLWLAAKRRWRWIGRPTAVIVVISVLTLWLVLRTLLYSYPIVLPSTQEVLQAQLAREFGVVKNRVVFSESSRRFRVGTRGVAAATTFGRPSLAQIDGRDLDRADAEVFFAERLADSSTAAFYRDRVDSYPSSTFKLIEPRLFRTWGPPLVAISHPWRRRDRPVELEPVFVEGSSETVSFTMPDARFLRDLSTLDLRVPKGVRLSSFRIGGEEIELARIGTTPYFRTARLDVEPGVEIELDLRRIPAAKHIGLVWVSVQRWTAPRPEHRRKDKGR